MRVVRVRGGDGGEGGRVRRRGLHGQKRTEMTEKRAKIGRVSVENQPVFGNNTHLRVVHI